MIVTVANPDRALTVIPTYYRAITTADVLRVNEYGVTIQLIEQDGSRQSEAFQLTRRDFRAIFDQDVPAECRPAVSGDELNATDHTDEHRKTGEDA